ncbi:MAG: hypothetical protein EOO20_20720 [Chryseobacterium sp.]|nr:MAG: hypothetical protein EOO20_20720 [Chryseobacterium sp.]
MQEETRDAIVSITLFAAVFGMVYVFLMTRHRERMSILEKGLDTSPFLSKATNNLLALKYGLFLVGIAIGLIAGYALQSWGMDESVSFASMVCFFGGLSLIIGYLIVKHQQK